MASLHLLSKLACAALVALGLTGCVDATVDVVLTGQSTAEATTTQVMGPDYYALVQMNSARKPDDPHRQPPFCSNGTLIETDDGGATCTISEAGRFSTLTLGSSERLLVFSRVAPDRVRIALPLKILSEGFGPSGDQQSDAVLEAFLAGHTLTLHFSGGAVVDTNMVPGKDGKSVEQVIAFSDLLNGTGDLPQVFYAILEAP